jgi:uncharacterized membrane protein YhaH (DUF805 family)
VKALRLLFGFQGRMPRGKFWLAILFSWAPPIAVVALFPPTWLPHWAIVPAVICWAWVRLTAAIKRLHDLDISGWWAISVLLIPMLPIIILGAFRGSTYENKHGPPLYPSDEDVAYSSPP